MTQASRAFPGAVAASLLLHALLVWSLLQWGFAKAPPPPPRLVVEMLPPPQDPPPQPQPVEPPKPRKEPEPVKSKAPVVKAAPAPARAAPAAAPLPVPTPVAETPPPGPPQHKMKSTGSGPATPGSSGNSGAGRKGSVYAPPEYAEKVKQRVNAAIVYPADAKRFLQQCWVEYTLTVDRNGNMLNYKIENCGDDRLDAAAQAALIKGGPYPPPPDSGASSYEIHGALVFTLR